MARRNTFFEDEKIEKKIDIRQLGRTVKYILPYKKILIGGGSFPLSAKAFEADRR